MECIICFEEINVKDFITMECCKQIIHKNCIKNWTKINMNKISNINNCFYCKQNNSTTDFFIDLINNETYNMNELNNDIENNNNIIETTNNVYNNNYKYLLIIIPFIISLVCIIGIIIIIIYF